MVAVRRLALCVLALGLIVPTSAHAAIRRCAATIDQAGAAASTELEAKRLAIEAWIAQAAIVGKEFAAWRLASAKGVSCSSPPAGGFVCRAMGQPCRVDQVPGPMLVPKPIPKPIL